MAKDFEDEPARFIVIVDANFPVVQAAHPRSSSYARQGRSDQTGHVNGRVSIPRALAGPERSLDSSLET